MGGCELQTDDMLSDLKAQAESLILSVNDIDGLLTCSLRPSNVFGPGDTEFVPYFLKSARYGFTKVAFFLPFFFFFFRSVLFCQKTGGWVVF